MITEIAHIAIDPPNAEAFEAAVKQAAACFRAAEGCHGMRLVRTTEHQGQYRLVVQWASVEAHTVQFRESEGFQTWRALAGPFFVSPPRVEHWQEVFEVF